MATKIKIANIYHKISKAASNIQYVRFFKRGTGEERHMIYRVAGSDDRSGNAVPIHRILDDAKAEVLTVFDLNKNNYRRINFRDVISLVIDQVEYEVIP